MTEYEYPPITPGIIAYLEQVQTVPAVSKVPKKRPARFIQIVPAGGSTGTVTQQTIVTFLCWAESEERAAFLAARTHVYMKRCRTLNGLPVYRVHDIGLPVPRPDPDTGIDRYQFTIELHVRGQNFTP